MPKRMLRLNRRRCAPPDGVHPLEHLFKSLRNSFVCVSKALFEPQNLLPDHRKAKVPRLDRSCVDRAYSDLVHSITFHLDKRIWLGRQCVLLLSIDISTQRKYRLWPSSMTEPSAFVWLSARNSKQVVRRALHSRRRWK